MRILLVLGVVAAALYGPASNAQTTSSTSTTGSAAQAGAGAQSGAVINQTFQGNPAAQQLFNNQSGTTTVRNTPGIQMPGIFSGSPCTVGGAAGGAGPGIGLSFGISYNDDDCELRMRAAMMIQIGQTDLAKEMLCAHKQTRAAYKSIGQPCNADRPVAEPVLSTQQVSLQTVLPPKPPVPGWCYTLTSDEKRRYAATCTP